MIRTIASLSLLLLLGAAAAELRAQWPDNPTGGSTAGMTLRPGVQMVTASWLKATPDTTVRYRLFRSTDSARAGTDVSGQINALTFTDKTLQLGTVYFYYVQAERPVTPPGGKYVPPRTSAPLRFMLVKPVPVEMPKGIRKP